MRKEIFWGLWVLFFSVSAAVGVVVYFAEQEAEQAELVPPGNIHFGPRLYNGPNDGWYKTEAGEWQQVEDGTDVGAPIMFQDLPAEIRGASGGKLGTWAFTADETAGELSECSVLQIDTDAGGKICIEPDGSVRITGAIPNKYGEFWRGVAREWPSFERTMCRERLIRQLRGDTIPWQEPDQ